MKKRDSKTILAILLTLLLLLGLTACGGSSYDSASGGTSYATTSTASAPAAANGSYGGYDYAAADAEMYWAPETPMEYEKAEEAQLQSIGFELPAGVKMIYRANLELETQEFDKAVSDIAALTQRLGGYFEEQNTYNRNANYRSAGYTVRVPAARFQEFLDQAGTLFHVVSQTQSAENVSEYYYDMESRLETAKIKLARLQDLLAKAENMEDIITIESAISDTEYQIENLSGELRHYDSLIGYSTIYVSLQETYQPTETQTAPLTFGDRMTRAFESGLRSFKYFLEDLALWLAEAWLPLLVVIAVVVIVVKLVRRGKAKALDGSKPRRKLFGKKDKNAPAETAEENKE